MNDASRVRLVERIGNLNAVPERLASPQSLAPDDLAQRFARHVLHGDERESIRFRDVVNVNDVGMIERGSRLGLLHEAAPALGVLPVQFRVLVRWESAKPVRLAGGPELPELTGQFYVMRLRGLPLMPPPKTKPEEVAPNPNAGMLQAIEQGSRLERKDKPGIPCAHLFTGSGVTATEVLLFFPRGVDPIQVADKLVTLESRFAPFHLSVKFPLKDMMYKGELAL